MYTETVVVSSTLYLWGLTPEHEIVDPWHAFVKKTAKGSVIFYVCIWPTAEFCEYNILLFARELRSVRPAADPY